MDELTAEDIEDTIALLESSQSVGMNKAEYIISHALSDDFKNRLVCELYELSKAMDAYKRRTKEC